LRYLTGPARSKSLYDVKRRFINQVAEPVNPAGKNIVGHNAKNAANNAKRDIYDERPVHITLLLKRFLIAQSLHLNSSHIDTRK